MYCAQCGENVGEESRFCKSCGAPVYAKDELSIGEERMTAEDGATAVLAPPPTATVTSAEPPPPPPVEASTSGGRRYLKPLAAAGVFVIAAAIAGTIVFVAMRGDNGPSHAAFISDANLLVEPVITANATLAARLGLADSPPALNAVTDAATALEVEVTRAQGAASVLDRPQRDSRAALALTGALTANLSYARRVGVAATKLSPVRATAAMTAAQSARIAWQSVSTADPELTVPPTNSLLGAAQLRALSQDQARAQAAKAAAARRAQQQRTAVSARDRAWVQAIDSLLLNSAETRSDLGGLINDVQNGTIDPGAAIGRIEAIISQRQDLQNQISGHPAPPRFQAVAELLRQSIRYSLDDDLAIQGWIEAWYASDAYTYQRFYSEHESATSRASAAKAEFLQRYNALRSQLLRLPPVNVAY